MSTDRYIGSLDPERRPVAREWAEMDPPEFQARMGVLMGDFKGRLDNNDQRLDAMCKRIGEMATPTWKKAGYGLIGLAIGAGTWWAERGVR